MAPESGFELSEEGEAIDIIRECFEDCFRTESAYDRDSDEQLEHDYPGDSLVNVIYDRLSEDNYILCEGCIYVPDSFFDEHGYPDDDDDDDDDFDDDDDDTDDDDSGLGEGSDESDEDEEEEDCRTADGLEYSWISAHEAAQILADDIGML